MSTPLDHAYTVIATLHPAPTSRSMIEITGLARKRIPVKRYFCDVGIAAEYAIELNQQGYNVFHSVNCRAAMSGFERDVPYVTALVLDLQPERSDIAGVIDRLTRYGIAPTIAAISGNGVHLYVLLSEPVDPAIAKPIGERLCRATDSDRVYNVNRIFRTTGTMNLKPNKVPTWCYLIGLDASRKYNVTAVDEALDRMGAPAVKKRLDLPPHQPENPTEDIYELLGRVSPHAKAIIDSGEKNPYSDGQVSRSEADWFVISELIRNDATDEQIHTIYTTFPIGYLKYKEAGDHYLNQTIESARRSAAKIDNIRKAAAARGAPKKNRGGAADNGAQRAWSRR